METFPVFLLGPLGGIGFGLWMFWMIATGKLVTRREADAMQSTIDSQRQTIQSQSEQLSLIMKETAPTLTQFLEDLRAAVRTETDIEKREIS